MLAFENAEEYLGYRQAFARAGVAVAGDCTPGMAAARKDPVVLLSPTSAVAESVG